MTIEQATIILEQFQKWRLGKVNDIDYTPKELSKAIDLVIEHCKKTKK